MSDFSLEVDDSTLLAHHPLPKCPHCGDLARPNILMFGDYQWVEGRTQEQILRYNDWLRTVDSENYVVIELGAGKAVPTVRWESESQQATLIRINPRDSDVREGDISIPAGSLEALQKIEEFLS